MKLNLFIYLPALCAVLTGLVSCNDVEYSSPDSYICRSSEASKEVDCINVQNLTKSERLMALSLQGLVNRDEPRIYTYVGQDAWMLDLYRKNGYITSVTEYDDPWKLLEKYSEYAQKAVVCDPEDFDEVNLATNIAGVEDRIILSSEMTGDFSRITASDDIFELSSLGLGSRTESFRWYMENIFPKQNHSMLSVSKGGLFMYDVYRDYLVEFRIPVFWLPGRNDPDYDAGYEKEIIGLLEKTPVNIPVLGFWPGVDENGKEVGYTEYDGVKLAGKYGKFTLVNTWVGNYSYHSGVKIALDKFSQGAVDEVEFDPAKKYVALVMAESGDAPAYFLYTGFFPRQWNDPVRGEVPISYGLTPSIRYFAPALLEEIYNTKTPNDYFFCSISGAGYCYPFEGYGSLTPDPEKCLSHYFSELTSYNMEQMDINMTGIYTHPSPVKWTDENREVAEKFIAPMPGLKAVLSGMHRTGYTGKEAVETIGDDVTVFHNVSFWSYDDLTWNDEAKDREAAGHLINEIRTYGADGQFIAAMFYSWHYGPRRLKIVKETLEKEGYVFITLGQLDSLYRNNR